MTTFRYGKEDLKNVSHPNNQTDLHISISYIFFIIFADGCDSGPLGRKAAHHAADGGAGTTIRGAASARPSLRQCDKDSARTRASGQKA